MADRKQLSKLKHKSNKVVEMVANIVIIWLGLGIFPFFIGLQSAPFHYGCKDQWARIEYIFLQYRLGCYLGSPPK